MEPFTTHTGRAIPLRRSNLIPTGSSPPNSEAGEPHRFADGLFAAWRAEPESSSTSPSRTGRPSHRRPRFQDRVVREHAVWALGDYGFRAVISARFGDIFRNNATKAGLLPVRVSPEFAESLQDALEVNPDTEITVDLVAREVRAAAPGGPVELSAPFDIDDYTRWRLMEGLDDISLTLRYADDNSSFEEHRPHWLPTADAVA